MTFKGNRTTTKSPISTFPVPPEGYQLLFTVTCTKCGAKEPTFSLEGRFPRHCSPHKGRSECVRSGAEFLPSEKRRVQWRVVEKSAVSEATGRHEAPPTPRVQVSPTPVVRRKTDRKKRGPASAGVTWKMSRLEVEQRYSSSDSEDSNEARYREWLELNTGSVSVVARPSAPQGTGRRR